MQITKLFYCYAHEDKVLRDELAKHLAALKRLGLIDEWYDRDISAGKEWQKEIDKHLNTANVILLLISPDFVHSDYCYSIEMHQALLRHHAGTACVIPIILRPVTWEGMPFGQLQALPTEGKPIISWLKPDEAFYDVAQGIRKVIEDLALRESTQGINASQKAPQMSKRISPFLKTPFQTHQQAPIKKTRVVLVLVISLLAVGISLSSLVLRQFSNSSNRQNVYSITPNNRLTSNATMPPTQIACPPSEKTRSAIMVSLQVGQNPNIIFVSNKGTSNQTGQITKAILGTLKRYDVMTHQIIDILNLPETNIRDTQISADGQWILFTSSPAEKNGHRQDKLQMIRIDGQGLQTLFCSTFSSANPDGSTNGGWDDARWSPDQQSIALVQYNTAVGQAKETIYLLQTASGKVESQNIDPSELLYSRISSLVWNGNTALDLISEGYEFEKVEVYNLLLDSASAYQMKHDVINHITEKGGICHDFDRSSDQTELLSSSCTSQFPTEGPGGVNIKQGPSTISKIQSDGQQKIIYQNSVFAIQQIRIVNESQLLFTVANLTGDTSQNGLWKINLDGSHLTHLFSAAGRQIYFENDHNLWANISRDTKLYAVKVDSSVTSSTLIHGSIDEGKETVFATASSDTLDLSVVGWTTM